jgi:hypothetical protein
VTPCISKECVAFTSKGSRSMRYAKAVLSSGVKYTYTVCQYLSATETALAFFRYVEPF